MSREATPSATERAALIASVIHASSESSTVAIFLHTIIAEHLGIGATAEKTLYILEQHGQLTAGEIARRTGLTTPSVTNLLDRLESKGYVRRVRDTQDRRRVLVVLNSERLKDFSQLFAPLRDGLVQLIEMYSNEQLYTIKDFLTRATHASQGYIEYLASEGEAT